MECIEELGLGVEQFGTRFQELEVAVHELIVSEQARKEDVQQILSVMKVEHQLMHSRQQNFAAALNDKASLEDLHKVVIGVTEDRKALQQLDATLKDKVDHKTVQQLAACLVQNRQAVHQLESQLEHTIQMQVKQSILQVTAMIEQDEHAMKELAASLHDNQHALSALVNSVTEKASIGVVKQLADAVSENKQALSELSAAFKTTAEQQQIQSMVGQICTLSGKVGDKWVCAQKINTLTHRLNTSGVANISDMPPSPTDGDSRDSPRDTWPGINAKTSGSTRRTISSDRARCYKAPHVPPTGTAPMMFCR